MLKLVIDERFSSRPTFAGRHTASAARRAASPPPLSSWKIGGGDDPGKAGRVFLSGLATGSSTGTGGCKTDSTRCVIGQKGRVGGTKAEEGMSFLPAGGRKRVAERMLAETRRHSPLLSAAVVWLLLSELVDASWKRAERVKRMDPGRQRSFRRRAPPTGPIPSLLRFFYFCSEAWQRARAADGPASPWIPLNGGEAIKGHVWR